MLLLPLAQTSQTPDLSPAAYWGVAGFLLVVLVGVLWSSLRDERQQHRALQDRAYNEFLPAILASTEQMRQSTETLRAVASKPGFDNLEEEVRELRRDTEQLLREVRALAREVRDDTSRRPRRS